MMARLAVALVAIISRKDSWMYLENLVFDATAPQVLGRFYQGLLGTSTLTDTPEAFESRLSVAGGPDLDLCFQRVATPPPPGGRLHLDLAGGPRQAEVVERALSLGARHLDIGQRGVPWVVLADPEGNPFCVMESRPAYQRSGAIAAIPVDSRDPARDLDFWTELSGWVPDDAGVPTAMRHRSGHGPLIEFLPEPRGKDPDKNRMHLDLRLEPGDDPDAVVARLRDLGGHEMFPDWGDLPWRVFADPSGNEFCLLPARSPAVGSDGGPAR